MKAEHQRTDAFELWCWRRLLRVLWSARRSNQVYQSISAKDFGLCERIYDYSTMTIVKPSNNEYINVTVETYTLENDTKMEIRADFIFLGSKITEDSDCSHEIETLAPLK